jgi:hypothetical protein
MPQCGNPRLPSALTAFKKAAAVTPSLEPHIPGTLSHWSDSMDLQRWQRNSIRNRGAPVPVEFEIGKQWSKAVWPV